MLGLGLSLTQVAVRGGPSTRIVGPQILISNRNQDENTAIGTTIGTFTVVGGTGTYTFTKTADPDSAFTLTAGALKNAIVFDYETATSHNVTIHADNGAGSTVDRTLAISVNDIDEVPPVITSSATQSVNENAAFSLTLTADKAVTWTKTGGADQALFTLTVDTLTMAAQDFEAPADANTDNVYTVQVTATSLTGFATNKTINVTVTDVADTLPAPGVGTLAWTSDTATTPPTFSYTVLLDADIAVGDTVRLQRSTVSDFSTGTTDYTNTVDSGEDAAQALTFSSGTWADGTWWARARTERPGADLSDWSNVVTKTLATSSIKTGLISYWEFENTSWTDSHTNSYTLTGTASPTSTAGKVGNALTLDGGTQWLSHTSNTDLQVGGQDFSFAFWFFKADNNDRDIINKFAGGGGNQEYAIYIGNDGITGRHLWLSIFNAASAQDDLKAATFGAIASGAWHFGVCTFNASTGLMTISIDAGTRDTFTSSKTIPSTSSDFFIGKGAETGNAFYSQVDQVGFWKRVLTTTEETYLYNSGSGRTYASL